MVSTQDTKRQRQHHKPSAGPKAERKKKSVTAEDAATSGKARNPKAFTFQSGVAATKALQRNLDRESRRLHAPLIDRTGAVDIDQQPPFVVLVTGPPKTGKSTLIRSLVKHYTKQNIHEIRGPITVVTGKHRRITFYECPNDVNAMVDLCKIADLVLLLVDASFGFEMETFECLNVLQVHGFPKVMGILTHLDQFKDQKRLRKTRKRLKHRFWTEICDGAKVFYLSGLLYGRYHPRETMNLARFISVCKFRPIQWRNTHGFVLADRMEDITDPALIERDAKCDRNVVLFGYVRGTYMRQGQRVHIPGAGDFGIQSIVPVDDPCPLPGQERKVTGKEGDSKTKVRRTLNMKERRIWAPMSDHGELMFDRDGVYVNVKGKDADGNDIAGNGPHDDEDEDEEKTMLRELRDMKPTDNDSGDSEEESQDGEGVLLFAGAQQPIRVRRKAFADDDDEDGDDDDADDDVSEDGEDDDDVDEPRQASKRSARADEDVEDEEIAYADTDSEFSFGEDGEDAENDEDGAEEAISEKEQMHKKAADRFYRGKSKSRDLEELVYGSDDDAFASDDDGAQKPAQRKSTYFSKEIDGLRIKKQDITKEAVKHGFHSAQRDVELDAVSDKLALRFIADREDEVLTRENSRALKDARKNAESDDDDEDGEDMDGSQDDDGENEEDDDDAKDEEVARLTGQKVTKSKKGEKPEESLHPEQEELLGAPFLDAMQATIAAQKQVNQNELPNMQAVMSAYSPGHYVRVEIRGIPCEFIQHFNPSFPIIVGGLLANEDRLGFLQVRIKKHRWHKKILKTNDPLVFSIGWRRFQSLPLYCIKDVAAGRHRMLKYTPEHMHCVATFFGPLSLPNTGFLALSSNSIKQASFRIAATGTVLENDESMAVVKKLKLTGVPQTILKNTAYIQDMFTSGLEVSKFVGASLRTVSGIRGQIKKPHGDRGVFRATFEDKIVMSDIAFLKTWFPVQPKKLYNPVYSLLMSRDELDKSMMRTVGQLRRDKAVPLVINKDSEYKPVKREKRVFQPLHIPAALQAQLPFSSKPKNEKKRSVQSYETRRAVVAEPEDKRVGTLLQQIATIRNDREGKRRFDQRVHRREMGRKKKAEDEKRMERIKESRKRTIAEMDKQKQRAAKKARYS